MVKETGFRATVCREWQRITSRPVYLLFTIILPVTAFFFLWLLFYTGTPRNLPVIVCDQDASALSHRFVRMLESTASVRIERRVNDPEEGKKILLRCQAYALILIPKGLERDTLRKKSTKIICYQNMQFLTPSNMISQDFLKTVDALVADLGQRKGTVGPRLGNGAAIALDTHALFNPAMNYRYFLTSALLPIMLQIFIVMISVFCTGVELREGTAGQWLQAAGGSTLQALAGKMLPYLLIFSVTGLIMQIFMFSLLEVPFRGSILLIIAATFLLIAASQCMGCLFVAVTGNLRMSLSFAAFYSVPAFAFTGVSFPVQAMSVLGKLWSRVLPGTYYVQILIDQSVRAASVAVSLPSLAVLFLFTILLPLPIILRFRQLLRDDRYWRRS